MTTADDNLPCQPYTASNRTIHLWGIGAMADYMLYVPLTLILPIFTTSFMLSPKLVGWALMLPRIVDGLLDPVLGHLSDNTHTRWGRRRPFIFIATLMGAIMVVGMWWASPHWSQGVLFIWVLAAAILLFIWYGIFAMSHVALGYELSDDYNYRAKVQAVRGLYFSLAGIGGGFTYWLVLRPWFGGEINGIRCISVVMAAIILVAGLIPVFTCRERFRNANRKHVNMWRALRTTLHVKPFVLVLLLMVTQSLGSSLYGAVAFYIGVYSVSNGDKAKYSSVTGWVGIVAFVCSFAMVPLAAPITRALDKRRGIILGYGLAFVRALTLPLFARPGHPWFLLIHFLIFIPPGSILGNVMSSIMPDICDIDELQSGERREGLFSAVMAFVAKMENSVVMLIGGYLVAWTGFNATLGAHQPHDVLQRLRYFGFTPNIIFTGVAVIIACFMPITREMMDDVRARLDARHAAAAGLDEAMPDHTAEVEDGSMVATAS